MKEFFGGVLGFVITMYALACFFASLAYGFATWQVDSVLNRAMLLVQQRGGVDSVVVDIITDELEAKNITVNSVTGSSPGRPYGSLTILHVGATYKVFGIPQGVGKEIPGTSIYQVRN